MVLMETLGVGERQGEGNWSKDLVYERRIKKITNIRQKV